MVGNNKLVRTRIAPSPTGKLHLGGAHTALFNWLFVKHHHGQFILRIEDTDQERSTREFARDIEDALSWLGLVWDEGPYFQRRRLDLYNRHANQLLDKGLAYWCFCTKEELEAQRRLQQEKGLPPRYSGRCRFLSESDKGQFEQSGRPKAVRFVVDGQRVSFEDLLRGTIEFDAGLFGDFIILKSDGVPTYNFAVVVDDQQMAITHVIRGEDHISNTPRQLLLIEALGFGRPIYVHLANILNPQRLGKLSKRFGAAGVTDFRSDGYLPQALINYLATLGWSHPEGREIFTPLELVEKFSLERVDKAAPAFDIEKLNWYNGQYIRQLSPDQLMRHIKPFLLERHDLDLVEKLIPLVRERLVTLKDFIPLTEFFFTEHVEWELEQLVQKTKTILETRQFLVQVADMFTKITQWQRDSLDVSLRGFVEQLKWSISEGFMTVRVAVTGRTATPPLFETLEVLGKQKTVQRIVNAAGKLA